MSLTMSIPYTILTYDPPSSPISYIAINKPLPETRVPTHRSTPPEESKSSAGDRPDKTPSARAKVLPWVQGVQADSQATPEGMFGPYPSRPQSMAEPAFVQTQTQSRHPFAYNAGPTLPFAALGQGQAQRGFEDDQITEYLQSQRPESEVLSRGAGMKGGGAPPRPGTETPEGFSATSPGMGTFGMEGRLESAQVPLPKSRLATTAVTGSPKKSTYTTRKAPPTAPLPPDPIIHNEPAQPKPDSDEQLERLELPSAHEHKPHHEHPFSHAEAQAKQIQAMEEARAAALAQLEAAQRQSILQMEQEMMNTLNSANVPPSGAAKGPRQTYDTMTSGPSFGHLLHQNGMPLSATQSMQIPPDGFDPRQITGMSDSFFRIPFGVPMGMSVPRPLLVMRDSAGAGLGLGLGPDLLDILEEEAKPARGQEDRSAFVETVEDEECSGVRTDLRTESPSKAPTQGVRSTFQPEQVARTESGLFGEQPTAPRSVAQTRAPPSTHAPTAHRQSPSIAPKAPSVTPSKARTKAPTKAPTVMSEAFPRAPTQAPTVAGGQSQAPRAVSQQTYMEYPDGHTIYSQVRTKNTPTIIPNEVSEYFYPHGEEDEGSIVPSHHGSVAPTTISNVKKLVAESRFHDETLCQLLDAARLNLIGDEAKKALQRAARARVIELRDLRERGEIEEGIAAPVVPDEPKSRETTPKKDKRSKSRSRKRSASEKTETVVAQYPPVWAQDIMSRLAAFDSRFNALEAQKHELQAMEPGRPATQHSQVTQDIPSNLIDELIFHELPSSGFTGGVHMPQGLTQSILFPTQGTMPPMPGYASQKAQTHYTTNKPVSTVPPPQSHYTQAQAPPTAPSAQTARAPTVPPTQYSQRAPTRARSAAPTQVETNRGHVNPDIPMWGSEVELPQADSLPIPNGHTAAPTINILAPTEPSVAPGRMSTRAPSRAASQTGTARAPDLVDVTIITEQALPEAAVPDPRERDLPAPPSESVRSHRPTPPSKSTPLDANTVEGRTPGAASIPLTQGSVAGGTQFPTQSAYVGNPDHYPPSLHGPPPGAQAPFGFSQAPAATQAKPPSPQPSPHMRSDIHMQPNDIILSPPQNLMSPPRDKIHVIDPLHPQMGGWKPWDMLTQRLYSWALIAEEKSFVRALEEVSLGRQVEEFPLSIFMMMTYKRLVRRNLSDNPPVPCDKLLVPPNLASAINIAVHRRRYHDAKEILLELWDSLGNKEPPRVIISLAPLGNDPDQWAAHRYDTVTKHLTTYRVSHLNDIQTDGRWEAISQAWPQFQIPDMDTLEYSGKQRIVNERRPPEHRHDNSLYAANIARNLLLGYRPERPQDLTKLRELVWAEVKRLLGKKRHGRLVVEPESSEHLYDA
ncbi:hypothetical protein IAT40_000162 [Kwoniella sp. CBS 6097]